MTDLHDRMASELGADRDELIAEIDRLRAEVEQLRAGADETPIVEGTHPTPGQWITRFLAASAHGRRDMATTAIENDERAARCFEAGHESKLKQLKSWERRLLATTAIVTDLPDGQLHVEWTGRDRSDWVLIMACTLLDRLIERHNAQVRELADVAAERTAAWQAYADVMGERQGEHERDEWLSTLATAFETHGSFCDHNEEEACSDCLAVIALTTVDKLIEGDQGARRTAVPQERA